MTSNETGNSVCILTKDERFPSETETKRRYTISPEVWSRQEDTKKQRLQLYEVGQEKEVYNLHKLLLGYFYKGLRLCETVEGLGGFRQHFQFLRLFNRKEANIGVDSNYQHVT